MLHTVTVQREVNGKDRSDEFTWHAPGPKARRVIMGEVMDWLEAQALWPSVWEVRID